MSTPVYINDPNPLTMFKKTVGFLENEDGHLVGELPDEIIELLDDNMKMVVNYRIYHQSCRIEILSFDIVEKDENE